MLKKHLNGKLKHLESELMDSNRYNVVLDINETFNYDLVSMTINDYSDIESVEISYHGEYKISATHASECILNANYSYERHRRQVYYKNLIKTKSKC